MVRIKGLAGFGQKGVGLLINFGSASLEVKRLFRKHNHISKYPPDPHPENPANPDHPDSDK